MLPWASFLFQTRHGTQYSHLACNFRTLSQPVVPLAVLAVGLRTPVAADLGLLLALSPAQGHGLQLVLAGPLATHLAVFVPVHVLAAPRRSLVMLLPNVKCSAYRPIPSCAFFQQLCQPGPVTYQKR